MEENNFTSTFGYKLIYVFRINDNQHNGILKIGDATLHYDDDILKLVDNCEELNNAATKRINQYTKTAGISYELLYTTLAINEKGKAFRDYAVHNILKRSNIKTQYLNGNNKNEWYKLDLQTAINAINACKKGLSSLSNSSISNDKNPIILRPEQKEAIEKTIKNFTSSDRMLWNAKMRFGKTICALEVVRRQKYKKTIILTHRPVVDDGWFEDFNKIFENDNTYKYGSKNKGEKIENLIKSDYNFVYFASLQDLRGSSEVGGIYNKNEEIFNAHWDFVVIDEAHEGTKTQRGERTIDGVIKIDDNYPTKILELSGTPFNLLDSFEENQIYTWDYVMEQSSKLDWEENHDGDYNPYADLPQMNIYTYDLSKKIKGFIDYGDKSFNFREFFRTWTGDIDVDRKEIPEGVKIGDFVHENAVRNFLDLLVIDDVTTNYPFSKEKYRNYFRHSLWMIPGVKEAKALSKMLNSHPVFGSGLFDIVNVAGDGDEENSLTSKSLVEEKITDHPENTYTITLSCGRLTTGVSIPAWTAVFMLNGGNSTSASSYLQTIFRVQTPANIGGKMKDKCYVFDFAPDRTLKMMAEAGQLSAKAGSTGSQVKMGDLLNFCPVISVDGSRMVPYKVETMLRTLKKAYADKVVQNGFDDPKIYNDKLLKLNELELKSFEDLKGIIGSSKQTKKVNEIDINNQGFTNEEWEELEEIQKKPKRELSEEEKAKLEQLKEAKDQRSKAISILRGISIRIPLLIYGANIPLEEEITTDNFVEIIDDESWEEFMPKGVTKEKFVEFAKYYDQDIFIEAGNRIRNIVKYADTLPPLERTKEISALFATFKNPDKETVLTPWKTVNMHMGDTIGGYNFYDEKYIVTIEEPRFIHNGEVTIDTIANVDSKILELNSKTGLYPLYVTYSLYKQRCINSDTKKLDDELKKELWKKTLEENIFVACKTPMAKSITMRTVTGFDDIDTNIIYIPNLIEILENNKTKFWEIVTNPTTWQKKGSDRMKFNAIVGNPPYQIMDGGNGASAKPVYNLFIEGAKQVKPDYISMISPSRWFAGGKGLDDFRNKMLQDKHIRVLHDYLNASSCFPGVEIKGGVSYFLINNNEEGKCNVHTHTNDGKISKMERYLLEDGCDVFIRYNDAIQIRNKIMEKDFVSFSTIVQARKPFGIPTNYKTCSENKSQKDTIKFYGQKVIGYVSEDLITKNKEWKDKWKVLVSEAIGSGDTSTDRIKPIIASPGSICSETYILIGPFETQQECFNLAIYTQTAFFLYMLGLKKITQHTTSKVYDFVPLQDFKTNNDIDWRKNIAEIDKQLFDKYNLTDEEREEIISTVDMHYQIEAE